MQYVYTRIVNIQNDRGHVPSNLLGRKMVADTDFPSLVLPDTFFPVTLLGIDQKSYGYAHITTNESWHVYAGFLRQLKTEYSAVRHNIPFDDIFEGMFVIARVRRGPCGYYIRAEVLSKSISGQKIVCFNLDEIEEFSVPIDQLFMPTQSTLKQPIRAIKFLLSELSFYQDTDFVQKAFLQLQHKSSSFMAKFIGNGRINPKIKILQLVSKDGEDLAELIREKIRESLRYD